MFFEIVIFGYIEHLRGGPDPNNAIDMLLMGLLMAAMIGTLTLVVLILLWLYLGRRRDLGISNDNVTISFFLIHWYLPSEAVLNNRLSSED